MKHLFILFLVIIIPFLSPAQSGFNVGDLPLTGSPRSVSFGYDIYINDQPVQDQQNAVVCSAFNGWIYAALSYPYEDLTYLQYYRSKDLGESWELMMSDFIGSNHIIIKDLELVTTGNSIDDLIFLLGFVYNDTLNQTSNVSLWVYNGVTGAGLGSIFNDNSHHIHHYSQSSDFLFPATGSNPGSIGVLYSKRSDYGIDSLVFRSSSNGGLILDKRSVITYTQKYINKVDLAYGRSSAFSSGRYFAVWEEKENAGDEYGHIYTAHTDPNFDSPFTDPVCIDSLFPDAIGKCRNPVIACQQSSYDNDSTSITEVILFERYNTSTQKYDIVGCFNKRATSGTTFMPFELTGNENEELQPDITYNPFDSAFLVTYFDKTGQKLPFIANNVNMTDPDNWQVRSAGFNDSANLADPHPRITLNPVKQAGAAVWLAQRSNGNTAAMYDAEYIYYTGLPESNSSESVKLLGVRPNPCTDQATVVFELKKATTVKIDLFSITGKQIGTITNRKFLSGLHEIEYDVSALRTGAYVLLISTNEFQSCAKIVVK